MSEKRKKGGAHLIQKEKKPRTKREKIRLAVILVLVILLAVLLVGFAVYRSWAKAPDVPERPSIGSSEKNDPNGGGTDGTGAAGDDPLLDGGDRKEDFYTFLVVGRDTGGGGNTDTILLAAYDVANQKLNVMSIPRDTMVNIPYDIKRINGVYNYAGGGDEGIEALYKEVSQLVGFVPDFEVVVEWDAVGELVDAIGGVYFDVPFRMYYNDLSQGFIIDLQKGYQLLNGDQAMQLVRYRKQSDDNGNVTGGYVTGDIGRIETQQAFLKEVIKQCLKISNVTRIKELAKVFTDNVQTDLTIGNLVWFAEQAIFGGLSMDNVNFITLPGNYNGTAWSRTYQNNQSYVLPYGNELLEIVNESFNPYLEDRTLSQLDIMSVNSDGSLSSTTGKVEDTKAATAPVKPSKTETPQPSVTPEPDATDEPESTDPPEVTEDPQVSPTLPSMSGSEPQPSVTPQPSATPEPTPAESEPPAAEIQEPQPAVSEELPTLPPMQAVE